MPEKTKVVFRFYKGEVVALFPEIPGDKYNHCLSYTHLGQHCDANPYLLMYTSRPARSFEADDLALELKAIGYDLEVRHRITKGMEEERGRRFGA